MILHLENTVAPEKIEEIVGDLRAVSFKDKERTVVVTSSKLKELPEDIRPFVTETFVTESDIQLASRTYHPETRKVKIGKQFIGGNTGNTIMMTGPCSVESRDQMIKSAEFVKKMGVTVLRGGAYKPRTSPYSFQGLGLEGLKLLAEMGERYDLQIVSEVRDATHVDKVIEYADIVQVGAKAMYDQGILRACGKIRRPVLLKRGFGTTLQEFVQAAEFIMSGGNPNVILCERGIRTFETHTRFTLDLCGVAFLKEYTNLPVVLDPSHAMGYRYGVADLTRACVAMGIDGLIIETHPNPKVALSDAAQQLDFDQFQKLFKSLPAVAAAVGRKIV